MRIAAGAARPYVILEYMAGAPRESSEPQLILGIDTCGPTGSVALARVSGEDVDVLGQTILEGRTYSATLISSLSSLLEKHGLALKNVDCIVAVSGPGSFTGVRVGLSAAKGLAEGACLPIVAVSRLAVLAHMAGVPDAALDAHRHEVFLRLGEREGLAGKADLAAECAPESIAIADDAAAGLISAAWPGAQLVRAEPPAAADAIRFALPRLLEHRYDDPGLLDGYYLRRSDAEIFGGSTARP
jgi:tRNA threonylcarbamoyladenosine biosynthesis protein TsaB